MQRTLTTLLVISLVTFFLGCSEPLTTREKGAGIGTLTGAGLGAIIGSATGHAGAGAGIGAAVGLIGGALWRPAPGATKAGTNRATATGGAASSNRAAEPRAPATQGAATALANRHSKFFARGKSQVQGAE